MRVVIKSNRESRAAMYGSERSALTTVDCSWVRIMLAEVSDTRVRMTISKVTNLFIN